MERRIPYVFLTFLILLVFSCNEEDAARRAALDSLAGKPMQKFVEVPPWMGIYQDTLPCQGCKGALTRLEFKSDSSYKKSVTFLGKGDAMANTFSTTGQWKWARKEGQLFLDSLNEKRNLAFQIEGDTALRMCDLKNKPLSSNRYLLHRL